MISVSVSLSVSCTVHVSGTGPVVYPLSCLQSVSTLAAGGVLQKNARRTTAQKATELSNLVQGLGEQFSTRAEVRDIVLIDAAINASHKRDLLSDYNSNCRVTTCECANVRQTNH